MTKLPRIFLGAVSATKMATTDALAPIPQPRNILQMSNSHQFRTPADPMTDTNVTSADTSNALRLPLNISFKGSESQQPTKAAER